MWLVKDCMDVPCSPQVSSFRTSSVIHSMQFTAWWYQYCCHVTRLRNWWRQTISKLHQNEEKYVIRISICMYFNVYTNTLYYCHWVETTTLLEGCGNVKNAGKLWNHNRIGIISFQTSLTTAFNKTPSYQSNQQCFWLSSNTELHPCLATLQQTLPTDCMHPATTIAENMKWTSGWTEVCSTNFLTCIVKSIHSQNYAKCLFIHCIFDEDSVQLCQSVKQGDRVYSIFYTGLTASVRLIRQTRESLDMLMFPIHAHDWHKLYTQQHNNTSEIKTNQNWATVIDSYLNSYFPDLPGLSSCHVNSAKQTSADVICDALLTWCKCTALKTAIQTLPFFSGDRDRQYTQLCQ